ncbi:phosphoesterase [Burkholderia phage BcepSauron]|uniref:Phosphoesterase n=1 Tax=Burkholderia phage BcepSauron TaxID=2530033 RepID=A0A482MLX9_9CAUD|nr:phosphoesterase [Burkholderia phage BcepSauron]QBQ74506.1 phosphoesterase [Burkholderia phage BcepSauron]
MTQKDNGPWFTADLHFNHNAILQYTRRGILFSDMPSHNQWIVSRINETVGPRGVIYFGGDIAFGSKWEAAALIERIETPNKFLICGNHDDRLVDFYKSSGLFKEVHEHRLYIKHDGVNIVLNHHPELAWNKAKHGSWMLHGHLHGSGYGESMAELSKRRIFDIGWDNSIKVLGEYRPFSFREIKELIGNNEVTYHHNLT